MGFLEVPEATDIIIYGYWTCYSVESWERGRNWPALLAVKTKLTLSGQTTASCCYTDWNLAESDMS